MSKIIINADDFGLKESCTLAIIEAFDRGFISSTTMCANGIFFEKAVKLAKEYALVEHIGIHLNITEGEPLTEDIKKDMFFCDSNGRFKEKINRYKPITYKQARHLYHELNCQIGRLRENGILISHADSHHHIHTSFFLFPVFCKVLKNNGIKKIRIHRNIGEIPFLKRIGKFVYNFILKYLYCFDTLQYFGDFKDIASLEKQKINSLEIMVHPEYNIKGCLINRTIYEGFPDGDEMQVIAKYIRNKFQEKLQPY